MTNLSKWTLRTILLLLTSNGIAQAQNSSIEGKIDSLFAEYGSKAGQAMADGGVNPYMPTAIVEKLTAVPA